MVMSNVPPYKTMRCPSATFASFANATHGGACRFRRASDALERLNILSIECILSDEFGFAMGHCIVGISPLESRRSFHKARTGTRNVSSRHSNISPSFVQRREHGYIFALKSHLDYCSAQFAVQYALFTRNLSIGVIVFNRTPFKVADKIVGFILILMIYHWIIVRVRDKCLGNKTMNHNVFLLPMPTQRYAIISVLIFVSFQYHSIVDMIGAGIYAPHAANHIAAFIANYISPFFFFFHWLILYLADKLEKKRKGYQLTLVSRIANSAYPFSVTNILKINDLNKFYFNLKTSL